MRPATLTRMPLCMMAGALLFLVACSSAPTAHYSIPEGDWKARISSQEKDGIRVSAGVPSAKESQQIFGKPLYKRGIQPVWLEISNDRDVRISFLPVGLDPQYFTPLEVANTELKDKKKKDPSSLVDVFFLNQGIGALQVEPGETRSGFIFSKLDEGTKAFNVDIIGSTDSFKGITDFETFHVFHTGAGIEHRPL